MKRFLSLLLVFAMVFGLAVPAYAEEKATVKLTADNTTVQVGDTVTVTMTIDTAFTDLTDWQFNVYFDDEAFELESSTKGEAGATTVIGEPGPQKNKSDSHYGLTHIPVSALSVTGDAVDLNVGTIATLVFKANKTVANAAFEVDIVEIVDYDDIDLDFKDEATGVNATVTVTEASTPGGGSGGSTGDAETPVTIPSELNIARITEVTAFTKGEDMDFASSWNSYSAIPSYIATVPQGTQTVTLTFKKNLHPTPYSNSSTGNLPAISGYMVTDGVAKGSEDLTTQEDDGLYSITLDVADMIANDTYYGAYGGDDYKVIYCLGFQYDESTDTPHTCVFDQEVAEDKFLATAATCKAAATYYKSCTCGEKGTETFSSGDLGDHTYDEETHLCTVCGTQDPAYWTATVSFAGIAANTVGTVSQFPLYVEVANASAARSYDAITMVMTYDPAVLQVSMVNSTPTGATYTEENGVLTVTGAASNFTTTAKSTPFRVIMKALALGDATMKLTSFKVDDTEIITDPVVLPISIGYPVTFPEVDGVTFSGDAYAPKNGSYSFTVTVADGYDTENMVVANNGTTLTAGEDGTTYTISSVSSAPVITVTGVKKSESTVDPDQPDVPVVTPAQSIGISGHGVSTTGDNTYTLTLRKGASSTLTAKVYPENATNQNVFWSSDAEDVATVSQNGEITAVGAGTATITATVEQAETRSRAANVVSTIAVTVNDLPEGAGYTVKMPNDKTVVAGDKVSVGVTVGHTDGQTGYNAFDMTFTYDATALTLNTTAEDLGGLTFTAAAGTVNVKGYGDDRAVDTVPFELEFTAVKTGTSDITLTSAKVDNGANAIVNNAPEAATIDQNTRITVTGYPVTLPDGFGGNTVANPGEDYPFTAPEDNYDYNVTVKVDGKEVDVIDNGDGSYTIPADKVTGPIVIEESHVGKTFDVTLGEDMTGETTAQYGTPYTATLNREDGYDYNVTIIIGGEAYTGYAVDGDTYTIPGEDITGAIIFDSGKTQQGGGGQTGTSHTVSFDGSGAGAAAGNATSVAHGAAYTFTLNKEKGYAYTVSASTASDPTVEVTENEDGSYTIASVTENITITIDKTLDITVEVSEYVTLNDKVMFLVLVTGEHEEGKCFAYNGAVMVYSEVYEAYAYLTVESGEYNADTARASITITDGENQTVSSANYDVNQTGLVDINDAQLVYDIYNGKYEDVSTLGLVKLLNADTVADKTVNVNDAIAVVSHIG